METKLEGRESVEARDWKKRSDSKGVYADRGGIPHCPPGRPLGEESLGMGATVRNFVISKREIWMVSEYGHAKQTN